MPAAGPSSFDGNDPLVPNSGMPPSGVFNTEFEFFDAEETYPSADAGFFDLAASHADALHSIDPAPFTDSKSLLAQPGQAGNVSLTGITTKYPPSSHRDSSSSTSSQSGIDSASPKTSHTSGDVIMTDDPSLGAWKTGDTPGTDESSYLAFGDGLNTSTMDMSTNFDDNFFDFESASSSPSPPVAQGQSSQSPQTSTRPIAAMKSQGVRRMKGHNKAQSQHSLTQSMTGLKTSGSRETSPLSNFHMSQESSPAAAFNKSPSPDRKIDLVNGFPQGSNQVANLWPIGSGQPITAFSGVPNQVPKVEPYNTSAFTHGLPNPALRLVVDPTPLKSRVETQIPIKLTIYGLPSTYKRLHLPTHTISKPKLLAKPAAIRSPDILELHAMLVCTSAMQDAQKRRRAFERAAIAGNELPLDNQSDDGSEDDENKPQNGGEVRICAGCITRERKRAGRKKHKKPEEEELWNRYEKQRVIVFNTQEVKEWQPVPATVPDPVGAGLPHLFVPEGTMFVEAPMRIACYCRHQSEKMGFQVIFTIRDFQDRVVAQQISSSIMITDDHKTHLPANSSAQSANNSENGGASATKAALDATSFEATRPFRQTQSTSDLQSLQQNANAAFPNPMAAATNSQGTSVTVTPRNLSRQASPVTNSGPVTKKRKASGSSKVPSGLAMTRLETAPAPVAQNDNGVLSASTSPYTPNATSFPMSADSLLTPNQAQNMNGIQQGTFANGPPTPNSNNNDPLLFPAASRTMSIDTMPMTQMYSAPTSTHPSRAPSPNHMRGDFNNFQQVQLAQALYSSSVSIASARAPQPIIHKIIPGEGPKSGGIEVTILGSGFTRGIDVMFGEQRATTTTYWGEMSLVCLLPPSPVAGHVLVSIENQARSTQPSFGPKQQPFFRYVDDDEQQLIRTALQVLGNKVGSDLQDVREIANSIIFGGQNRGQWGPSMSGNSAQQPGNNFNSQAPQPAHSVETGLLRVLELIDLDDSVHKARINLRRSTGQTMLHLACSLGLIRLVAGLLSRGANPVARDKGGFTPLHMAAMNDHPEIVRRLMVSGADPSMRSLSGLTPADVAVSRDMLRTLRRSVYHSRSRSGGSLHSRVNSATSLRSVWDNHTIAPARPDEFLSDSSDSLQRSEDSQDDTAADSEEIQDENWLDMRRPSIPRNQHLADAASPPPADVVAGMASPSAAMAAFREQLAAQIQQIQQSMAMHFPNLQMPALPPMPAMPVLPDYQAYLHSAPVMQRIASLVPNIGGSSGSRPGSADQQPRDAEPRGWEFPFFGAKDAPPPAYEDIFPQSDVDTKQASAAQAAADAEADMKCTALYDQETSEEPSKVREVPTLLQIGRKNAITKEQQEDLQRAHAERLKTGSRDKMLWMVWVPLLIFFLGTMLYSVAPSLVSGTAMLAKGFNHLAAAPRQLLDTPDRPVIADRPIAEL